MKGWLVPIGVGACALFLALCVPRQEVLSPRFGVPALPPLGGTVTVEVRTALPWTFFPGAAPVLRDGDGRVLERLATRWRGNRARTTFHAATAPGPASTPRTWSPKDTYCIVHIADLPTLGDEGRMRQFVEEMKLLGPDLILTTGDLCYVETQAWYGYIMDSLKATGVPVIVAPGNHEHKSWPLWLRNFGSRTQHRVDAGPFTILSLDSRHGRDAFTPSQMRWLETELEQARQPGRAILILSHHPIFPAGPGGKGEGHGIGRNLRICQSRFVDLCRTYGVAAVLSGHWHQDAVFDSEGRLRDDTPDFPGTRFIITTSLGHAERLVCRWPHRNVGYRVLEFQGGQLLRYTEDPAGSDLPVPIWSQSLGRISREDHRDADGAWTGTTVRNGCSHPLRGSLTLEPGPGPTAILKLDIPPHTIRTFGREAIR